MLIYRLEKLTNDEGYRLNTFDLFLSTNKLSFEVHLFVFDICLLNFEHLQVTSEFLILDVVVIFLELLKEGSLFSYY